MGKTMGFLKKWAKLTRVLKEMGKTKGFFKKWVKLRVLKEMGKTKGFLKKLVKLSGSLFTVDRSKTNLLHNTHYFKSLSC